MSVTCQHPDQSVLFESDATDQALLEAVNRELSQQRFHSFSDLCKQALRQFLLNTELTQSAALFVQLERQIVELQFKLAEVERKAAIAQSSRLDDLTTQVEQLTYRLDQLNAGAIAPPAVPQPAPPPRKLDPLLSRLGPLLEDF